jgi:RHS repeat-associated protein
MIGADELDIRMLFPSRFRMYDPIIGRFNAVDPLSDKSNNISPYAFVMNNPLLFTDRVGLDTTKATLLQEVVITATRIAQYTYSWFSGANVDYMGSGWGHGPRRLIADRMGSNNASNIFQLGLHSQFQSGQVNLSGQILDKIKNDEAMIKFQNDIIKALKTDPRFKNMAFVINGKGVVEFGGKRWGAENENWGALNRTNPLTHLATWAVAVNELTWATRHASIGYAAAVKSDGTIVIDFHLSDTLDLSGQKGRSEAYNNISNVTGFLYHDVIGGNSEMKVNADWQIIE